MSSAVSVAEEAAIPSSEARRLPFWMSPILWGLLYVGVALLDVPPAVAYGAVAVVGVVTFVRSRTEELAILAVAVMLLPDEEVAFVVFSLIGAWLAAWAAVRPIKTSSAQRLLVGFCLACAVSSLVSQFTIEHNFLAFPFFCLTFFSSCSLFFLPAGGPFGPGARETVAKFAVKIATFQLLIVIVQSLPGLDRSIGGLQAGLLIYPGGDFVVGSTSYQNGLCLLFIAALLPSVLNLGTKRIRRARIPRLLSGAMILGIFVTGSKAVVVAAAIGCLGTLCAALGRRGMLALLGNRVPRIGGLFALVLGLATIWAGSLRYGQSYFEIWISREGLNHKFLFLQRALEDIPYAYGSLLTGTGPGTVGTRAANSRAYDTLYKDRVRLGSSVPAMTSEPARRFFVDLYAEKFVTTLRWASATLASPFSSLISLLVETGVLGSALFAAVLLRIFLSCIRALESTHLHGLDRSMVIVCAVLVPTVLVVGAVDTIFERPTFIGAFWLTAGICTRILRERGVSL